MTGHTGGWAADFDELIERVIAFATDESLFGGEAWTVERHAPYPLGTILKAPGRRDGEWLHIGLLPHLVNNNEYATWFLKLHARTSYFEMRGYGHEAHPGCKGTDVAFNMFPYEAAAMHLGVFRQQAPGLDWDEQPGGIPRNEPDVWKLFPFWLRNDCGTSWRDYPCPPCLPGTQYPALSYGTGRASPEARIMVNPWETDLRRPYAAAPPAPGGPFRYELVKRRSGLAIAMDHKGRVDVAYAGFFTPYDAGDEKGAYAFPACVIGGTSGLTMCGQDWWYHPGQITPTPVLGARFDYRAENWTLSHGLAPFACRPYDGGPSQVWVQMPDGHWRSPSNYVQGGVAVIDHHVCNSYVTWHHFVRQAPVPGSSPGAGPIVSAGDRVRPTEQDISDRVHVLCRTEHTHLGLLPVQFAIGNGPGAGGVDPTPFRGLLGEVPGFAFPTAPMGEFEFGEHTISGVRCLVLPNGWIGRRMHYPGHACVHVHHDDVDALEAEDRKWHRASRPFALVLKLEDKAFAGSEEPQPAAAGRLWLTDAR